MKSGCDRTRAGNGACFSVDDSDRFAPFRRWSLAPMLTVFMLNPSAAHKAQGDQTVSRLERFVGDWGFGAFEVVNAFSIVSTDTSALRRQMKIGGRAALIRDETDAHGLLALFFNLFAQKLHRLRLPC